MRVTRSRGGACLEERPTVATLAVLKSVRRPLDDSLNKAPAVPPKASPPPKAEAPPPKAEAPRRPRRMREPPQYQCSKCLRAYNARRNLVRHVTIECGREPQFKCPHCQYTNHRRNEVKKHIEKKHPEVLPSAAFRALNDAAK